MRLDEIEKNLKRLCGDLSKKDFIYDFLLAYGKPASSIARLKNKSSNSYNLAKNKTELIWKENIYFKKTSSLNLNKYIDRLLKETAHNKYKIKYLIVTNFNKLIAYDLETNELLETKTSELYKYPSFFLSLTGKKKTKHTEEHEIGTDIQAAEKMARLFKLLQDYNNFKTKEASHSLNVFFSRLLFCFFAEDTGLFNKNQFTNGISSHTDEDGSDVSQYLENVFKILNTPINKRRKNLPEYLKKYDYVNGGLFADSKNYSPKFTAKSRSLLIECGAKIKWADINPDIFGSMIQNIVQPAERGNVGLHYTSYENIMKVIKPLFLDELRRDLASASNLVKLKSLREKIQKIKIFDPACGSGNFLIVTYKELCKIELELLVKLQRLKYKIRLPLPSISLNQFYGIELSEFAHEVALLSLILAEHQVNIDFRKTFNIANPTLPLKSSGNIYNYNATNVDWSSLCSSDNDKVYIIGNPPYYGFKMQKKNHKEDIANIMKNYGNSKKLDYICCWFLKAAEYIEKHNAECAFVSTNSICQGEHVSLLWPHILSKKIEIFFAYKGFKWKNEAKSNANVNCIIVGLRKEQPGDKFIFENNVRKKVSTITPYLAEQGCVSVHKTSKPISNLPKMLLGNIAADKGNLFFTGKEKRSIVSNYRNIKKFFKRAIGAKEYLYGHEKWCLWIDDRNSEILKTISPLQDRLNKVREYRISSDKIATRRLADFPYKFTEIRYRESPALLVPTVTSERREYLPVGFIDKGSVIIAPNNAIYDPEPYVFGVISSRMHMIWVKAVGGRRKTDIRYSSALCYNNFPIPTLGDHEKNELTIAVYKVIEMREKYSEKTLSELYDPKAMPEELRNAHKNIDILFESFYQKSPFKDDAERLQVLFSLYSEITGSKNAKSS